MKIHKKYTYETQASNLILIYYNDRFDGVISKVQNKRIKRSPKHIKRGGDTKDKLHSRAKRQDTETTTYNLGNLYFGY